MEVSELDLRILSELAYLDLNYYYESSSKGFRQGMWLIEGSIQDDLYDYMVKNGSTFSKEEVSRVLARWELFGSVQFFLKLSKKQINNPLLDAFAFRFLDSKGDKVAIAFRGSNPNDENQWAEDMIVNMEYFFIEQILTNKISQIDLAV